MQAKNDQFDEQAAEECCVEIADHAENIMRDVVEHLKKLCPKGILINPTICFRTSLIILRGPVRGVSGMSIDTPRILKINTAELKFQSVCRSKI